MNPNVHSIVVVTSRALLGLLLVSGMTGCMAPKSYVDPQFRGASYLSLEQRAAPRAIKLEVVFQTNGKENRQLHQRVRSVVSKVLLNTRLFVEAGPAPSIGPDHLHLVINNVGNIGSAVGQGIATGLTLGLVGAKVVDGYEITAAYTPGNGPVVTKTYKHAIHSTIGLRGKPEGLEPVAPEVAFDQVIEETVLNLVRDLQKEGVL